MWENEYLSSLLCILDRNHRMPSSENSSPTIDVLKRLVAQQKSSRHQHHEPMADELSSCPTTPIYNKVLHDSTTHQHLPNQVAADKLAANKTEPPVSKTVTTTKAATTTTSTPQATTASSAPKTTNNRQQSTANKAPQATKEIATTKSVSAKVEEPEENIWWMSAWSWLRRLLDFRDDKAGDVATIESLKGDVEFRGTKLWILICAILVASIGLNVNSTAVIIGAMLISPLMGPIIGFGLGFGIADLDLVRKSLRNLALTTLFSILTATIYFLLTPLDQPGSELLGRTEPSLYDVLIAFFGGAAGLIAGSSKSKGQVLPGVAIATALMPPLCTAGFGLATGNWPFFFGAIYLYIINSVFIAFATFVMVRIMRLESAMRCGSSLTSSSTSAISAPSTAMSLPTPPIAMPTSAALSAGASFTPSPIMQTLSPAA